MSIFKKTQFKYIGAFKLNNNKYEVIEDTQGELINIFFKGIDDVECYTITKSEIEKQKEKDLLKNTKLYWIKLISISPSMMKFMGIEPKLQTFNIDFWNDVIIPLKSGDDTNFIIGRL